MGMALSYFYNFIVPTTANISDDGPTAIDMEIKRGQFEQFNLK